jgi:hypothetical protein
MGDYLMTARLTVLRFMHGISLTEAWLWHISAQAVGADDFSLAPADLPGA